MQRPSVSVIVPARDAAPTLGRTLQALRDQQVDAEFEVIVIDDGSRDATAAIAREFEPRVTVLVSEHGAGPGGARNRAVAAARADVLAFTDADCRPASDWLAQGLRALESADLVQGHVAPDPAVPRTPFDRSLEVAGDGGFYQTANLFVRREVFAAVGGFHDWALAQAGRRRWTADTRRGRATRTPIGEDSQFAWAARRLGFRSAYAERAVVHHEVVPGTLADAIADRWHWTRDMPGLVGLVPELRDAVLYHRVFFADWSAQFDLALGGVLLALVTRRRMWLVATVPYGRRVARETAPYRDGRDSRGGGLRRAARYALGAPAVDAATLAGFIMGSVAWRTVVL